MSKWSHRQKKYPKIMLAKKFVDVVKIWLSSFHRQIVLWSAKRPTLIFAVIIGVSVLLLPAVTIAALTPLALLFTYTGVIVAYGSAKIFYTILFQGFLFATLLLVLFVVFFTLGVFASVLHSYRSFFSNIGRIKNK